MRKSLIRPDRTGESVDERYKLTGLLVDEPFGQRYQAEQIHTGARGLLWLVPKKHCSEIRFRRESHKLAQFTHPHAAPLVDFGAAKADWFLVHAAREGQTLAAYLAARGPCDDAQVVRLLGPIVASIAEAHTRALAHGRLSLEHVFLRDLPDAEAFVQVDEIGLAGFFGHDEAVKADLRAIGRLGASLLAGDARREIAPGHPSALAGLFYKLLNDFRPPPALEVLERLKAQPGAPGAASAPVEAAEMMGDTLAPDEAMARSASRDTLWDPTLSVDIAAQDFEDFERLGLGWRARPNAWAWWAVIGVVALLLGGAWLLHDGEAPPPPAPPPREEISGIKVVTPPSAAPSSAAPSPPDAALPSPDAAPPPPERPDAAPPPPKKRRSRASAAPSTPPPRPSPPPTPPPKAPHPDYLKL
ncbi:hypothetical protein KKF91_10990 [Myxococcota bacterium]|nr:hypothetical protein [Myxococcota bacterium]